MPKKTANAPTKRGTKEHGEALRKRRVSTVDLGKRTLTDGDVAAIVAGFNRTAEAPIQRDDSLAVTGNVTFKAKSLNLVAPAFPLSSDSSVSELLTALENERDLTWSNIHALRNRIDDVLGPYTTACDEGDKVAELASTHVSRRLYRLLESLRAQNRELVDIDSRVIL